MSGRGVIQDEEDQSERKVRAGWSPGGPPRGPVEGESMPESDDQSAIVVPDEDKRGLTAYADRADMSYLSFYGQPVEGAGGKGVMAVVDQQRAEVGVIAADADIVIVIVSHQQDVRQSIPISVDDGGIAIAG